MLVIVENKIHVMVMIQISLTQLPDEKWAFFSDKVENQGSNRNV